MEELVEMALTLLLVPVLIHIMGRDAKVNNQFSHVRDDSNDDNGDSIDHHHHRRHRFPVVIIIIINIVITTITMTQVSKKVYK